jgi:diguanylate cyclase (GGDEF)-like protein
MSCRRLVLGTLARWVARRTTGQNVLFAVPDAWHALGPAAVLALLGTVDSTARPAVYVAAFVAACGVDLASSTLREAAASGIAPRLQLRVIAAVWLVDACLAPVGLLFAFAARHDPLVLLLMLPLIGLLVVVDRDRNTRIDEAQRRLGVVARERTRLQAAVSRLGDAFAAKLDMDALTDVVLHGSIDALDGIAGRLIVHLPAQAPITKSAGQSGAESLLELAGWAVRSSGEPQQLERDDMWAFAIPFTVGADDRGTLAVARQARGFTDDEQALILGLVEQAQAAAEDIVGHELLREQAQTDPLTRLGNRRKLETDLGKRLVTASREQPMLLMLFDLDGFKSYNDTFGHVAGDALLARLSQKLQSAVSPRGSAYRLGGDEFCVLLPAIGELEEMVTASARALEEGGENFAVSASCGSVLVPHEATTTDYALQLADKRMYAHKHGRPAGAREQAHEVLMHILRAKRNGLPDHSTVVARLAVAVGLRLGMNAERIDELARAAELHDIGKVGIPDAILEKPGSLDTEEWEFIRQHTILGERILNAAPALRPVATIVRSTHERWDGAGYPDGLHGGAIPLAARIIAACDAYDAIVTTRCYRPARTSDEAQDELRRESGHQFDPEVVTALLAVLERSGWDVSDVEGPSEHARSEDRSALLATEVVCHVREFLAQRG